MKFDDKTKEMYLCAVHPKVTVEEVKKNTSWDLKVAKNVEQTEPPTVEEIRMVRGGPRSFRHLFEEGRVSEESH